MSEKLPYYMAYPVPHLFDDDRMERRDFEYMKSMYPALVKRILPYVEEECDRMDYKYSMLYDEYPDKVQVMLLRKRIVNHVLDREVVPDKALLQDLIDVLLWQEIYRRRCDDRSLRRRFY